MISFGVKLVLKRQFQTFNQRLGSIGDGKCDGILNVPAYKYDLGDCCKPLKDAICEFEDDYFCHMFTDFHGRILNAKMSLSFFFLTTVFPRIVAAATILF